MSKESIRCPYCNCGRSQVTHTYSIRWRNLDIIRRRRVCRHCGLSYFTRELPEEEAEEEYPSPPSVHPPAPPEDEPPKMENPYL